MSSRCTCETMGVTMTKERRDSPANGAYAAVTSHAAERAMERCGVSLRQGDYDELPLAVRDAR